MKYSTTEAVTCKFYIHRSKESKKINVFTKYIGVKHQVGMSHQSREVFGMDLKCFLIMFLSLSRG